MSDARHKAIRSKHKDARQIPTKDGVSTGQKRGKKRKPYAVECKCVNTRLCASGLFPHWCEWGIHKRYRSEAVARAAVKALNRKHPEWVYRLQEDQT